MTNEVKAAVERAADRIQTASEGPTGTGIFASEAIEIILSELAALPEQREPLEAIRKMVEVQANDEGLWFVATTAPEAYLQKELRRLHGFIEHQANGAIATPVSKEPGEATADLNVITGMTDFEISRVDGDQDGKGLPTAITISRGELAARYVPESAPLPEARGAEEKP